MHEINVCWFRRDLRLDDHAALYHALHSGLPVLPLFILDTNILNDLPCKKDRRVCFIFQKLEEINKELEKIGSSLYVRIGTPLEIFNELIKDFNIRNVFANHDYEPYAIKRDEQVRQQLLCEGIYFKTFKDQVIFERNEIAKENGEPYMVFSPYAKRWKANLYQNQLNGFPSIDGLSNIFMQKATSIPSIKDVGFESCDDLSFPLNINKEIIHNYDKTRNIPSIAGTSKLGIHLRFGTISIRKLVAIAMKGNEAFLNELIWREFFMQMLWHRPELVKEPCKKEYANINWVNNESDFEKWCSGNTGYPIVDAGMRELNSTGFMHNRVRMITAGFLVKHLLIDWRWGEAYFAEKLNDYELASNNGNWQWVAGCGCDAAPYFRIFNPETQTKRFDPQLKYIREWIPELDSFSYPLPIIDHKIARERCLNVYKKALNNK